ncbi:MAG: D-alanyl-lipoteichoic acid biosynthesis protein DltB, partial [Clostridium sp.]
MTFVQYGDFFYLYILILCLIPAVILGLRGKSTNLYGGIVSLFMLFLIIGMTVNMRYLVGYVVFEIFIIFTYLKIRKKNESKYVYWGYLFLALAPLIFCKLAIKITGWTTGFGFVGISYLTFKVLGMIIEIYDGAIKEINLKKLFYFTTFFPTISSGPIDRWRRFEENLNKKIGREEYINEYLLPGIRKIAQGALYKFVLAFIIDTYWLMNISDGITFGNSISYMYAYTLFLFFDFAGYSLFAVGTSYILKIKTPDNFNKPFLSKDMKEFWTRWHISLSRWFGDYIFSRFVLSSMRKKRFKSRVQASHVAQIITMFIMGVWHGLTVYYLLYGVYQGVVLVLTDIYQRKSKFYKKYKKN